MVLGIPTFCCLFCLHGHFCETGHLSSQVSKSQLRNREFSLLIIKRKFHYHILNSGRMRLKFLPGTDCGFKSFCCRSEFHIIKERKISVCSLSCANIDAIFSYVWLHIIPRVLHGAIEVSFWLEAGGFKRWGVSICLLFPQANESIPPCSGLLIPPLTCALLWETHSGVATFLELLCSLNSLA